MLDADISGLNLRYGIPGELVFKEGPGALTVVEVNNRHAHAVISLQGAQVMSWTPSGQHPVFWLSPNAVFARGRSIRGGIPVCWPWFGIQDGQVSSPSHGYARTAPWEVLATERCEDGSTRLSFRLVSSEAMSDFWPHQSPVELALTIGRRLDIELVTSNIGPAQIKLAQALHAYFVVSDIRQIQVLGLETSRYLDKVDNNKIKQQDGPVRFDAETDRIYLDSAGDCAIEDPGLRRRIRIAKRGSRSTVVWNPWAEKSARLADMGPENHLGMVCVESANVDDDAVSIAPGDQHCLGVTYTLEALS